MLLAILAMSAIYPQMPAVHAYEDELATHCPNKHLELLNPDAIAGIVNRFPRSLSDSNADAVRSQVSNECRGKNRTDSCINIATFRAAYRLSLSAKLAGQVCSLPMWCTGPGACTVGK